MTQETLEEAAARYTCGWGENDDEKAFTAGAKWQQEQDKKCYHPMTERKHTSDVHFECTICGYNNY